MLYFWSSLTLASTKFMYLNGIVVILTFLSYLYGMQIPVQTVPILLRGAYDVYNLVFKK